MRCQFHADGKMNEYLPFCSPVTTYIPSFSLANLFVSSKIDPTLPWKSVTTLTVNFDCDLLSIRTNINQSKGGSDKKIANLNQQNPSTLIIHGSQGTQSTSFERSNRRIPNVNHGQTVSGQTGGN